MKTRKEINKEVYDAKWNGSSTEYKQDIIIELLLDIRDLINKK